MLNQIDALFNLKLGYMDIFDLHNNSLSHLGYVSAYVFLASDPSHPYTPSHTHQCLLCRPNASSAPAADRSRRSRPRHCPELGTGSLPRTASLPPRALSSSPTLARPSPAPADLLLWPGDDSASSRSPDTASESSAPSRTAGSTCRTGAAVCPRPDRPESDVGASEKAAAIRKRGLHNCEFKQQQTIMLVLEHSLKRSMVSGTAKSYIVDTSSLTRHARHDPMFQRSISKRFQLGLGYL